MNEWILLAIFTGVSLLACCIGFKKFVWFLSVGYGFAVAALGIGYCVYAAIIGRLDLILILQSLLMVIYGARLSLFLLIREIKNAEYRKVLGEATKTKDEKPMPLFVLITIWIMVGPLYVMQTSPAFYRVYNGNVWTFGSEFNLQAVLLPAIGLLISLAGVILESLADSQKSAQKKTNPKMVATQGLYKAVRCPNYFGEILFWTGLFVGSVTSLTQWYQWLIVVIGWICIVYIMINGAQRLDRRQEKNYGSKEEYRAYADHTPLIFPLLPIYHIGAYKPEDLAAKKAAKEAKKAAKKGN